MKNNISVLLLVIAVLGGTALRLIGLSDSPPSLNWDEAALGYNAYSISETGRDEYGEFFPIFTRSFDDYKSAIPIYFMIPSIRIFGLNEFGVRFPSVILGIINIAIIFLLVFKITESGLAGLSSSFALSIEPWAVHYSRTFHEATTALFFFIVGWLMFIYSKKKNYLLPISMFSFLLSLYTYHSNKLIVPLFLGILFLFNRRLILTYPKKILASTILVLVGLVIPFIFFAFSGQAFARAGSTNIFIMWQAETKGLRNNHLLPPIISHLIHNDTYYFLQAFFGRYLSYFSPTNLFLKEPPENALAGNSLFNSFEFVGWLTGLLIILKKGSRLKELIALMLISPIPAALTWNWFQPTRSLTLLLVFSIAIGIGLEKIIRTVLYLCQESRYLKILLSGGLISLLAFIYISWAVYILDSTLVYLPLRDSGQWQPGFRETVPIIYQFSQKYDQVIIETPHAQPYIFYLLYSQYPPNEYLKQLDLKKIGNPRKHYDFGKFKFRKIYWPEDRNLQKTLFVGNDFNLPTSDIDSQPGAKVVTQIMGLDGYIAAKVVSKE